MRAIDQRITKLEKRTGLRGLMRVRIVTLNDGDPDPPEIQGPDVFTMIIDLRQNAPDN